MEEKEEIFLEEIENHLNHNIPKIQTMSGTRKGTYGMQEEQSSRKPTVRNCIACGRTFKPKGIESICSACRLDNIDTHIENLYQTKFWKAKQRRKRKATRKRFAV
jgi:hypothetical protein